MTDAPTTFDPIRRIAHDSAADATPLRLRASTLAGDAPAGVDTVTTFDDFAAVTDDLAGDIERAIRAGVDA